MKNGMILAAVASLLTAAYAEKYEANWESLDKRPTPQWWRDAKFGIFIHWGVYAVPAYAPTDEASVDMCYSEHYHHRMLQKIPAFLEFNRAFNGDRSYGDYAADFTAEHFDAKKWAELFRKAGAKYAVLTSKHHDGFALWPSKASAHWNAMDAGPKRDICREFMDAMHAGGLYAGFYFSHLEYGNSMWERKETLDDFVRNVNMVQFKELADDYGADIIWPDGEWFNTYKELRSEEFLAWLFNESKVKDTVVVNDRWGKTPDTRKSTRGVHGGHYTTEYGFETGDISEGSKGMATTVHPWEECRGFGRSFGYNRFEGAADYMSEAECIELLVRIVSGGGNLLLNIGPDRHGLIPPIMEERLLAMGRWLEVNGEAIYGTTGGTDPHKPGTDGLYLTRKPDALYAIVSGWRQKPFAVACRSGVRRVTLLGSNAKVAWTATRDGVKITPPDLPYADLPCAHLFSYKIDYAAADGGAIRLVKLGTIDEGIVEANPIVFKGRSYLMQYIRYQDEKKKYHGNREGCSYFRFLDLTDMKTVTPPFGKGLHMGNAFVDGDRVVVTCVEDWGKANFYQLESTDLVHWSEPRLILSGEGWAGYNTSVCKTGDRYVMVFELGKPKEKVGQPFTMFFAESTDLRTWKEIPGASFGCDFYTGSPALRHFGDWFYFFYLAGDYRNGFRMRVARSKNLKNWTISPYVVLDYGEIDRRIHPALHLNLGIVGKIRRAENINASDFDFCEQDGRLRCCYSWGNQRGTEFLSLAEVACGEAEFCRRFFEE